MTMKKIGYDLRLNGRGVAASPDWQVVLSGVGLWLVAGILASACPEIRLTIMR